MVQGKLVDLSAASLVLEGHDGERRTVAVAAGRLVQKWQGDPLVGRRAQRAPFWCFIGLDPSGARLYAANQRSDSIVEFRVDAGTGLLAATGRVVKANTPVC